METQREITATGWLSPDGEFIPCEPYNHISTAREIVKEIGTTTKYEWRSWSLNNLPGVVPPDDVLYGNGWISIVIRSIGERGFDFCRNFHAPVTDVQVKMLREFAEKHDFFMSEHGRLVLKEIDDHRKGDLDD